MSCKTEKEWTTESGLNAVVVMNDGSRCGYVGVKKGNPLFGIKYQDLDDIDVHGGLTFSGVWKRDPDAWLFGYDCNHDCDRKDPNSEFCREGFSYGGYGEFRSLEYCVLECEKLAKQLSEIKCDEGETK